MTRRVLISDALNPTIFSTHVPQLNLLSITIPESSFLVYISMLDVRLEGDQKEFDGSRQEENYIILKGAVTTIPV